MLLRKRRPGSGLRHSARCRTASYVYPRTYPRKYPPKDPRPSAPASYPSRPDPRQIRPARAATWPHPIPDRGVHSHRNESHCRARRFPRRWTMPAARCSQSRARPARPPSYRPAGGACSTPCPRPDRMSTPQINGRSLLMERTGESRRRWLTKSSSRSPRRRLTRTRSRMPALRAARHHRAMISSRARMWNELQSRVAACWACCSLRETAEPNATSNG